jgi:transposase
MVLSRDIRADYDTRYMFPPALEDWVSEDHPARFIREFVDLLDLRELGFKHHDSIDGAPGYAPDLLLKVWIYGYLKNIRSSRFLEEACREHLSLVWLSGNHAPDHNTLWRFTRDNSAALKGVFKQVVRVAMDSGLVSLALHAVDGTKLRSRTSAEGLLDRKDVERLLNELDDSIDEMLSDVEKNELAESGEYRLPSELADRESLRGKLRKTLAEMDAGSRKKLSPEEPEARLMNHGGRIKPCYNSQVVADEESGLIVAQDVVNEENDMHQLTPMIEKVEENIGAGAECTLADAGYYSSEELSRAEEKRYSVLVNSGKDDAAEFHWSRFEYDEANDCVICPLGERLTFGHIDYSEKLPRRVYVCRCTKQCERRRDCTASKRNGRKVKIGPYHQAVRRNSERLRDEATRDILRKRKAIVERVFAIIKEHMGFRRFTGWGLDAAKTQWAMLCAAYNLKIIYKHWKTLKLVY